MIILPILTTSSKRFSKFRPWAELRDPEGAAPRDKIGQKIFPDIFTLIDQNRWIDIFTYRKAPNYKIFEQILVNFGIF